jgi:hypothetical protein
MANDVRRFGAAAGVAALLFIFIGCADDSSDDSSHLDAPAAGRTADNGAGSSDESAAGAPQDSRGDTDIDTATLARDREVVRTGTMQVVVDDVSSALRSVRRLTGSAEGFVADEQATTDEDSASITVRVPSSKFDSVRDQVGRLGEVASQNVKAEDVTAKLVDLDSRVASLRKSVARLQSFLGRSNDVAQLSAVEGELARRETELEAMLGQQRVLRDQVSLGTLTVELSEEAPPPSPSSSAPGFTDGLQTGWVAVVDGGRALLAALGFLLPFVPVLVPLAFLARFLYRRRPPARPSIPPPPPASAVP